jgi:hypothetical protein
LKAPLLRLALVHMDPGFEVHCRLEALVELNVPITVDPGLHTKNKSIQWEVTRMGINDLFKKYGMFPSADRQVTFSNSNQSRSESAVSINPLNPGNMIAISKKFIDPAKYHFTVEPLVTTDGGYTWSPLPLPAPSNWDGMISR